jgi:hypothetical protein
MQNLPLIPLLAAFGSGIAFALLQIAYKRALPSLGGAQANPLLLPSWLGILAPFWALLMLLCHTTGWLTFNLSFQALVWPFLWAICSVISTTGLVWLLRNFSLSEVAGYKKALITLGAAGVDILVFNVQFPWLTALAVAILLGGSLGLSGSRNRLPTRQEWLIICLWCAVLTIQITLYKTSLQHQPHVLSNTILAQGLVTLGYAALWALPHLRHQPTPPPRLLLPILAFLIIGVLLEGFAYAGLPLAVVLVVTILPAALMSAHDLWQGHLPATRRTALSLLALLSGFVLLLWR